MCALNGTFLWLSLRARLIHFQICHFLLIADALNDDIKVSDTSFSLNDAESVKQTDSTSTFRPLTHYSINYNFGHESGFNFHVSYYL